MTYNMNASQLERFRKVSSLPTSTAPTFRCARCGNHKLLAGSTGNKRNGKWCKQCSEQRKVKE